MVQATIWNAGGNGSNGLTEGIFNNPILLYGSIVLYLDGYGTLVSMII